MLICTFFFDKTKKLTVFSIFLGIQTTLYETSTITTIQPTTVANKISTYINLISSSSYKTSTLNEKIASKRISVTEHSENQSTFANKKTSFLSTLKTENKINTTELPNNHNDNNISSTDTTDTSITTLSVKTSAKTSTAFILPYNVRNDAIIDKIKPPLIEIGSTAATEKLTTYPSTAKQLTTVDNLITPTKHSKFTKSLTFSSSTLETNEPLTTQTLKKGKTLKNNLESTCYLYKNEIF